jgi:uncharacterized membrane protein
MNNLPSGPSALPKHTPDRAAKGPTPHEPLPNQRRAFADALSRHGGKSAGKERREQPDGALAALTTRGFAATPVTQAPGTAGDVDAQLHAQLDRIAAAIAEFAKGAEPEIHLSLPLGTYKVEGAVLGRDLAGQLNILLVSGNAVPPAVATQWTQQLNERLLRRELRIGRIDVQAPAAKRALSPA